MIIIVADVATTLSQLPNTKVRVMSRLSRPQKVDRGYGPLLFLNFFLLRHPQVERNLSALGVIRKISPHNFIHQKVMKS